ncbi:MAG: hypothetical protein ACXIUM_02565 [Wenzhouxiangella sp.]
MNAQSVRRFSAVVYPSGCRWLGGALFALSRLSLLVIAVMLVVGWFFSPPLLVRLLVFLALLPGLLAVALRMVFAVRCELDGGRLEIIGTGLYRRAQRLDIGTTEILSLRPWSVPLPGPGLSLELAGTAGVRTLALQTPQAPQVLAALTGSQGGSRLPSEQAALVYVATRSASRLLRWHRPWFKFGLFGLFPLFVLFRLHQNIMFGGLLGQYHLQGLGPWLSSLAYHWIMVTIYLVLFAAFWRGWVEAVCWLAARYAPARADSARRWAEILALLLYFGGIPGFIVWRSFG